VRGVFSFCAMKCLVFLLLVFSFLPSTNGWSMVEDPYSGKQQGQNHKQQGQHHKHQIHGPKNPHAKHQTPSKSHPVHGGPVKAVGADSTNITPFVPTPYVPSIPGLNMDCLTCMGLDTSAAAACYYDQRSCQAIASSLIQTVQARCCLACSGMVSQYLHMDMDCHANLQLQCDATVHYCYCNPERDLRETPIQAKQPSSNGCGSDTNFLGVIPGEIIPTGFEDACNGHDICYSTSGSAKDQCDSTFLLAMLSACKTDFPPDQQCVKYNGCLALALAFHKGVTTVVGNVAPGWTAFLAAQQDVSSCVYSH